MAREPLRERRWAQLMLALYRAGRQADALRAFTRLRSALAEELGIGPSAELVMLERSVLEQSSDLDYVEVPGLVPGLPGLTPGGPQAANPTSRSAVSQDSPPSGSDARRGPVAVGPRHVPVCRRGGLQPLVPTPGGPLPAAVGGPSKRHPLGGGRPQRGRGQLRP